VGQAMGCNQEARPDTIARFLSTKSSRRKRFFFSRRRDTLFRKTKKGSRDFVGFRSQPAGYPAITPLASRRKRFFSSRRRDTLFRKTKKGSRDFVGFRSQPAGYPAITPLASRRKRFFFSRRRDTFFRRTKKGSRDFVGFRSQPAGYPAMNLLVMLLHNLTYTKHLENVLGTLNLCSAGFKSQGFSRRTQNSAPIPAVSPYPTRPFILLLLTSKIIVCELTFPIFWSIMIKILD
jgi:hypothetical protein